MFQLICSTMSEDNVHLVRIRAPCFHLGSDVINTLTLIFRLNCGLIFEKVPEKLQAVILPAMLQPCNIRHQKLFDIVRGGNRRHNGCSLKSYQYMLVGALR
jgi:hypothetical protein